MTDEFEDWTRSDTIRELQVSICPLWHQTVSHMPMHRLTTPTQRNHSKSLRLRGKSAIVDYENQPAPMSNEIDNIISAFLVEPYQNCDLQFLDTMW